MHQFKLFFQMSYISVSVCQVKIPRQKNYVISSSNDPNVEDWMLILKVSEATYTKEKYAITWGGCLEGAFTSEILPIPLVCRRRRQPGSPGSSY